ncbi:protein RSI-1-like [Cucumis sativus]|uniref:protein RSI-1-like n=1 Tax=Cucumis sativus TaxID=3659 RepID=UPI0005EC842C|nr:protein RSI-1-like [Cucumis sativus]
MASSFTYSFFLFSILFLLTISNLHLAEGALNLRPSDCKPKCSYRCSATTHRKPCMFFCQKCCAKCLCVPSGTYGNKQECPCYNNWKTQQGGPKCP